MTRQQVVALEGGKANPTVDTLRRIVRPFRLTLGLVPAPDSSDHKGMTQQGSLPAEIDQIGIKLGAFWHESPPISDFCDGVRLTDCDWP